MTTLELIPSLLRASLEGNKKAIEASALMIVKKVRKDHPEIADAPVWKAVKYSPSNH